MSSPKLFEPITVGNLSLQNRVVLAPMTRLRNTENAVPHVDIVKEYYTQRASTPGTLLITEATCIAPKAGGITNIPGLWSEEQLRAWKQVCDMFSHGTDYGHLSPLSTSS